MAQAILGLGAQNIQNLMQYYLAGGDLLASFFDPLE
jgi:hypothetical protein